MKSGRGTYLKTVVDQLWRYKEEKFKGMSSHFEKNHKSGLRPPVFNKTFTEKNVLLPSPADGNSSERVLNAITPAQRHRWFGSMKSSQALAQSVFGNIEASGKLNLISKLKCDDGKPLFFSADDGPVDISMEQKIESLGEKGNRRTSLDVVFLSRINVAVECKFTETDFGKCSRIRLRPDKPTYNVEHCDGSYRRQRPRKERCSLTEIDVAYWRYIPELFKWRSDIDHSPCPLNSSYQLVRNILAVAVSNEKVNAKAGHVVLIYDDRNPAFQEGGSAYKVYEEVRKALKRPSMLQKCSWQKVIGQISDDPSLDWLVGELEKKYGLKAERL